VNAAVVITLTARFDIGTPCVRFMRPSCTPTFFSTGVWKMKAQYLPNHVFIGIFTYFAAAFTVLLGIQDKNSALGCGYDI
ncbi:unnamed protein product, partial [Ectocarpus sp. 13 AM-2016]